MPDLVATAIFCEDIREESRGTYSIIGVMGDNALVPTVPGAMPRLAMYTRIHLSVDFEPCEIRLILAHPTGERVQLNSFDLDLVRRAIDEAKALNNTIAGIYSQLIASPFPVATEGRIRIELEWNEEIMYVGGLNFITSRDSIPSSNDSSPPSEQSPTDAPGS